MISLAVSLVATFQLAAASAEEIVVIQYSGDANRALQLAEQAVAARPGDVTVRLAGACAAIEANRLDAAATLLAPLERAVPVQPRALVLRRLVARRSARPREPLLLALATAWHEAGRPDLERDEPTLGKASEMSLPPLCFAGAAERLLFDLPRDEDARRALSIEASHGVERQPVVVALQVLGTLAFSPCPSGAARHDEAIDRARAAAQRALHGDGYPALAALTARCPRTSSPAFVDELGRIASAPALGLPRTRAFDELLSMAEVVDPATARRRAISAWFALDLAAFQLQALSPESFPDASQALVAGRHLETIGWRLADGSAWLERMVGLALVERGARLQGAAERIEKALEPRRRAYQRWAILLRQRGQWPFAAEWREWTPDEVGRSAAFLDAAGEPSMDPSHPAPP